MLQNQPSTAASAPRPSPSLVRRFSRNTAGRDLVVGDIHGTFTKLREALRLADFDPTRDRLFSVGDLVDRGPESDQALDWLAQPWFFAVQGNHEDMAIRWPEGQMVDGVWTRNMQAGNYMANGGGWNIGNPPEASREFAAAFAALPIAMEVDTAAGLVGIVHADCPREDWHDFTAILEGPDTLRQRAAIDSAQWSRDRADRLFTGDVTGVRAVIVGHTPMERPTTLGNVHFIDTMGWRGKAFTLLDAATLRRVGKAPGLEWNGV